ncbi:MAG: tetratricopeptide repeat protein [Alphaproteobacteria bacterium]|jgi:TPR repeat protein
MKKLFAILTILLITATAPVRAESINPCLKAFRMVEPNAFELCKDMAENKKNPLAQYVFGNIYYFGLTPDKQKDFKKAQYWYNQSAVNGNLEATYSLGVLYENGQGVETDYGKAFKWYLSAAGKGHPTAQFNVGNLYAKGAGVRKNPLHAFKWYKKAANQDFTEAQVNIANAYVRGVGIKRDFIEAYKWYLIAKNKGNKQAGQSLLSLTQTMSPPDIKKAQEEAKKWNPVFEYKFDESK